MFPAIKMFVLMFFGGEGAILFWMRNYRIVSVGQNEQSNVGSLIGEGVHV